MGGASALLEAVRQLALIVGFLAACRTAPPPARSFSAPPEKIAGAVLAVLQEDGEVDRDGDAYETGWRPDAAAGASWTGFGAVLAAESRFRVIVEGSAVSVEARSRVYARRGPRRRAWEPVDARPAAERLLQRIEARLQ